jgi:hypothetical protein
MDKLRATVIFNNASVKLIAIESINWKHIRTDMSCRFAANMEPIAVIVCHRRGAYAMDMSAQPMILEQLQRDVPGLARMLHDDGHGDS